LGIAFFGGAELIGYPDLIGQAHVFSTMVLAIILSLSMVAWMRFRHHGWRPSLEMGERRWDWVSASSLWAHSA